ncbi:MAG: protein translocase subunit SecF [Candidatus Pacebacteria bacterium]|nr:protein translocase subunit SecF [Candidatus Paceibacterota bacterium]MBT3511645.1 protein translocase subunit SecF [Candidatus Paceibacterota bacterium]MBT4004592.1 protein translocase subunit SecF [Candidatus Paceibacterota bacterium]MBT4359161.1 protein translocase subunit SecF [Candidatus Paceibacterota bacterium]MBT6899196.1 protein translocase subunit SecF [Candidatus Paceibacterota bacterium]
MKWSWLYFLISLLVIIPGIVSLTLFGLKPSIDFTGGSLLEVNFTEITQDKELSVAGLEENLQDLYELSSIQQSGDNKIILKGKHISNELKNEVLDLLATEYGVVVEERFETVGPSLGKELLRKTLTGVAIAAVLIMIYVWVQFSELKYGVSAILAMFHDSIILLGIFSLLGYFYGTEVDMLFVTALLTTLSFSVHDTIVVYDRIRELKRKYPRYELVTLVNTAVTETLSRSINNSVTIIIMLSALAMLGGDTIRWFAIALLVGAVTGTYSSTFTAAPLLLLWDDLAEKLQKKKK